MKEFNIKDIEIEDEKVNPEELLTGEVIKGLSSQSNIQPNAELEDEEYVKFPDGTTQKVIGDTHDKGGVKVNIPDGTEVLSDSLKPTTKQLRNIEKEYGLTLSKDHTFANILDKYVAKIGLKKLYKEQEEVFEELKKEMSRRGIDANTSKMNISYLSKKINALEESKKPLEEKKATFYDKLFATQEDNKPEGDTNPTFKQGGTYNDSALKAISDKYGVSLEVGKQIMDSLNPQLNSFAGGGTQGESNPTEGDLTDEEKALIKSKWNGKTEDYLAFKKAKETLSSDKEFQANLFSKYKETIEDDKSYSGRNKAGWYNKLKGLNEQQVLDQLLAQEERNARLAAYGFKAKETSQNPYEKGKNTNKEAIDWIKKNPEGLGDIKFDEGYAGQAAYIAYDKAIQDSKYKDNYRINPEGKSDEAYGDIKRPISGIDNYNTNTTLGQRLNLDLAPKKVEGEKTETTLVPEKKEETNIGEGKPVTDLINGYVPKQEYPRLFYTPDQSVLPPSSMEAHLKNNTRLERIDPTRIGIENNLQAIAEQQKFVASTLEGMPDAQRAAVMANLLANSNKASNQAATNANVVNAQNQSQAELFNIQQAGQEQLYNQNNALSFEQRQLTAKAKTEEALNRYYDFNRVTNINNFQNQQKLNLLDSLFPDYNLDFYGASVSKDPTSVFRLPEQGTASNDFLKMMMAINGQSAT